MPNAKEATKLLQAKTSKLKPTFMILYFIILQPGHIPEKTV